MSDAPQDDRERQRRYVDTREFVNEGYLQELNRRFLHPLGMALEVVVGEDGEYHLGGVWDSRDDLEGIVFSSGTMERDKFERVEACWWQRHPHRHHHCGWMCQPPPHPREGKARIELGPVLHKPVAKLPKVAIVLGTPVHKPQQEG